MYGQYIIHLYAHKKGSETFIHKICQTWLYTEKKYFFDNRILIIIIIIGK